MKDLYGWHLPKTEAEINQFWREGTLTLDTNVLLDLYRYHKETRDSLVDVINSFRGRLWLSHQAASEFFENRKKVILLSREGFKDAGGELDKLQTKCNESLAQLRGNRIIPEEIIETLRDGLSKELQIAREQLLSSSKDFPDFLVEDPILEHLLKLFDGCVGEGFSDEVEAEAKKEAERRVQEQVPPGYMDKEKGAARASGDYFVWRQVLTHSKESGKPMILVTSEKKEDWWEVHKGKTAGPRPELIREAAIESNGNVIIYHTERFLEYAKKYMGVAVSAEALEEVRSLSEINNEPKNTVAVLVNEKLFEDEDIVIGKIDVVLNRRVHHFTVSPKIYPALAKVPHVTAELKFYPPELTDAVVSASTGTVFDLNIHVKAAERSELLPEGEYSFDYVVYKDAKYAELVGVI